VFVSALRNGEARRSDKATVVRSSTMDDRPAEEQRGLDEKRTAHGAWCKGMQVAGRKSQVTGKDFSLGPAA
jgi:hypothetical protein